MRGFFAAVYKILKLHKKILLLAVAVVIKLSFFYAGDYLYYKNRIYPGIHVEGCSIGGKDAGQAKHLLSSYFAGIEDKMIHLRLPPDRKKVSIDFSHAGFSADWESTIDAARSLGRESWFGRNLFERSIILVTKKRINLHFSLDEAKVNLFLADLSEMCELPPRDASFVIDGHRVIILESQEGYTLAQHYTQKILEEKWTQNAAAFPDNKEIEIEAVTNRVKPQVLSSDLEQMGVDEMISSYTTNIAPGGYNRWHNIRVSALKLHYYLLAPEQEFSFNRVVGEITQKTGYLEAPIIVGNKLVDGIGGGVCQVSTTLYNAVLLAKLPIVERHNHTIPVAYVPLGRDATIAYGYLDLKFKNTHSHYLLFGVEITEGKLNISLFGKRFNEEISIFHTNMETIPAPVVYEKDPDYQGKKPEMIEKGAQGYRVTTWRVIYLDGKEIAREKLSSDYYHPIPYIYRIRVETESDND